MRETAAQLAFALTRTLSAKINKNIGTEKDKRNMVLKLT